MFIKIQLHGPDCPPFFGESEFYEKKREKAIKVIMEQVEIIKECDAEIAKAKANENKN